MACPAGVEPATYGLERLKICRDNKKQWSTAPWFKVFVLALVYWAPVESRVGIMASTGVCQENRHFC